MTTNRRRCTFIQFAIAATVSPAMLGAFYAVGVMTGSHAQVVLAKGGGSGKSGSSKPGWGCGDMNHTHIGPPGHPGGTKPCKTSSATRSSTTTGTSTTTSTTGTGTGTGTTSAATSGSQHHGGGKNQSKTKHHTKGKHQSKAKTHSKTKHHSKTNRQ